MWKMAVRTAQFKSSKTWPTSVHFRQNIFILEQSTGRYYPLHSNTCMCCAWVIRLVYKNEMTYKQTVFYSK